MSVIREITLPGIGQKFEIKTRSGDKLVVIVHDDGRRELYHFHHTHPDDSISMISLDDNEARQVSAIIGGIAYKPKAMETVEVALNDLVIEWYKIESGMYAVNKSIGELEVRQRTSTSIVALIAPDQSKKINPGPQEIMRAGMIAIALGERQQIQAFKRLIDSGGT